MGKYNSSVYRVRPLMEIIEKDYDAFLKLLAMLNIPVLGYPHTYQYDGENCSEKLLKPSKRHLSALIAYMAAKQHTSEVKNEKRKALFFPDPENPNGRAEACTEALADLENTYDSLSPRDRHWFLFEGFTHPDIFIEGEDYVIVCEGKWTEPSITTKTTHLSADSEFRNQMIRHIQGALNDTGKKVYGFYIVDENCKYRDELKKECFRKQLETETIRIPDSEKEKIFDSFYGYTTWQEIEKQIEGVSFKRKEDIPS